MTKHFTTTIFIAAFLAFSPESDAQYSFGTNSINGIKIIVEQKNQPVKILGKAKATETAEPLKQTNAVTVKDQNSAVKINQASNQQLQSDLQNKVSSSGAYVSKSSSPNPSNIQPNTPSNNTSISNYSQRVVYNSPALFSDFQGYFNSSLVRDLITQTLKDSLCEQILNVLNPKRKSGGKVEYGIHHNTNLQLGAIGVKTNYFAHAVNPAVTIEIQIPRNRFFLQITTPTVFGSDADPNGVIFFDLTGTCTIQLPTNSSQTGTLPRLGNVKVVATNVSDIQSKSLVTNALKTIATIIKGPAFLNQLRQDRLFIFPTDVYNKKLSEIRKSFSGVPPMRIENYPDANMLVLKATEKEEEKIYLR